MKGFDTNVRRCVLWFVEALARQAARHVKVEVLEEDWRIAEETGRKAFIMASRAVDRFSNVTAVLFALCRE